MSNNDDPDLELEKTIEKLADHPSGDKMMHAVVMTAGPGTRMLELTRSGPARRGIKAWVDGEMVVWLTTDRSALMPVTPGRLTATFEVRGQPGKQWRIRTTKPGGATGGANRTLPASGLMIGQFRIVVP